ncbi:hypothetical protein [Maribacter hydrothermalis]|uniref:PH domain-containing protein n=1 Tax=Maribacter hydrothermalis TaxID=1836467 RepID=A0A1B7ZER3_9FLAO|nr:hypothetical protein [Maribacter hydrothermalis]APQ17558.1 hypothetical protein BTR34_09550 [Maribacter hydrothermalis]OBR42033.1 hypothetical protein A9200_01180 [Maribacter hydrothermalis]
MQFTKKNWVWTITLILTVVLCTYVLILHFKNWVSSDADSLKLRSGFYAIEIPFNQLDSVVFVERLPPMERLHGFSAMDMEKGIFRQFKDSLTEKKVYVFVDNINQQKVKLVYKDSCLVFFNLKDSVETLRLVDKISSKINVSTAPN